METYSPKQVSIIVGSHIVTNWEEVTVEKDEDDNLFSAGADGEVAVTENANELGMITIKTKQTSKSNLVLSALGKGTVVPITIVDKSGKSLHVIPLSKRVKFPGSTYGKEAGEREWAYRGSLEINISGGNG